MIQVQADHPAVRVGRNAVPLPNRHGRLPAICTLPAFLKCFPSFHVFLPWLGVIHSVENGTQNLAITTGGTCTISHNKHTRGDEKKLRIIQERRQKGTYTHLFQLNGAGGTVRKVCPREVTARASICLRFNYNALARRPQPMQSTRTLSFFRAGYWGWRHRGAGGYTGIPPFDYNLGGDAPATLLTI